MKDNKWLSISMIMIGFVVASVLSVARGDFLGKAAAEEVQQRLEQRMDRQEQRIREELARIYGMLEKIDDKLKEN